MELEVIPILKESKLFEKKALRVTPLAKKLGRLIESVEQPAQKTPLKLEKSSPECKLRLQYLKDFLAQLSISGIKIDDSFCANFPGNFQAFLEEKHFGRDDKVLEDAYQLLQDSEENEFVHEARIEGVILRTSPSYVSVITLDGSEEVLLRVNREFVGLGIKVRTGDVISAVNPKLKRNQLPGHHSSLDPELKWCSNLYKHEVDYFLEKLKEKDDACILFEDFLRSFAVWKYVLNVFVKDEQQLELGERCKKILEVCQKISDVSSTSTMAGTIRNFWTSFEESKFFNDVLPTIVQGEAWQKENVELLKNFLENLLKHLPECGVRALEMVNYLNIQNNDMEFMKKLSSILALNVAGVKDNPKHLKWNQQPIIPVSTAQLTTDTPREDLPRVKVADKKKKEEEFVYKSEEEYIMTYYTLMREECFHKLKNGIKYFLSTGTFDPKDIMMYQVRLLKPVPNVNKSVQEGLDLMFELKNKTNNESDDPDNSNWLMFGNLLCLSFDGTFQGPVWGIISGDPVGDTKDNKTQIQVSLCSERNKLSEAEVIRKLQQLEDQGFQAYMVESNTFYRAYGPPLEVLQQKETVPFKEQLVQVKKCTNQPSEYLKNLKKPPGWSIIFRNPICVELHEKEYDYSYDLLIKEFMELRKNPQSQPILDEKQLDAIEQAFRNKVTLIQGPPGTGKSYVGEALLQLLLSMEVPQDNGPVLVVTYKNHALDNFLQTCAKKIPEFLDQLVRVGKGSDDASEELKERRITELLKTRQRDDDCQTSRNYYQTSQRLKLQLEAMKPEIEKCVKRLRCSNKFTLSVFIEEADDKHIEHLCTKPEYAERIKKILRDKNFRVKHFEELCKMIKEPLQEWLPDEKEFEKFAGRVMEKDLQSCVDEDYGEIKEESTKNQEETLKDEACNSRQSLPSEEREERRADFNDDQEEAENESADDDTPTPEETTLIVLPDIPDEKLGNVKAILNTGNIQELKSRERIQMVYALQRERYKTVTNEFLQLTQEFSQKQQRRKEVYDQRQIKILQQHCVIGMTVSGAAIRASWLESIKPSVMIVEEAAEILESQLVAVIPSSVQHLIMIGDHQQLRPQVHYEVLCRKFNFHISMFERLIKGGLDYTQLNQQGRMSDDLAQLVRELGIYDEYKTRDSGEGMQNNRAIECLSKSMYFYDHNREEKTQKGSHSMYNEHEADEIVKVAKYLVCDNDVKTGRITILCSYRGQVWHLKKMLKMRDEYRLSDITVTTIDSFQGKENDIILLSLVRSKIGPNAKIGYLSSINRICVAVSRARIGLYLFGNTYLLKKKSSRGWKKIIDHMSVKGLVGKNILEILSGGAVAADGASPRPRNQSPRNQSQSPDINWHQNVGRPQQQSTPLRPPQDDQHSQERQPVEETRKHNPSPTAGVPSAKGCNDQHSQEKQPVKETSKHNTSPTASGNQCNSPSADESEAQEMSWVGDTRPSPIGADSSLNLPSAEEGEPQEMSWVGDAQPSAIGVDGSLILPSADESEAQEMSWAGDQTLSAVEVHSRPNLPSAEGSEAQETLLTGDPQASAVEPNGRPLQETGDIDKRRPGQDTYLPKHQEQEEREESEKVQPVEETSKGKKGGQLVIGTQSDMLSLSGDVKASVGEDVGSPQQDSNPPVCESPLDEKKESEKVQPVEETSKGKKGGQLVIGTQSEPSLSGDIKASGEDVGSPQQDSNPPVCESPLDEKKESEKVQPVEETSKGKKGGQLVIGTQSDMLSLSGDVKASGEDVGSPQQDSNPPVCESPLDEKKESEKVQPVEETSKGKKGGQLVIGTQSEPSLSGDIKASGEDVGSPQQDSNPPVCESPLDEKKESEKVQPVEETSKGKKGGQLVIGTQSEPSLSGDIKASGEDVGSPQQDSNPPVCESPLDERKERKIFDDEDACIVNQSLQEAPGSADLIRKLQNLDFLGSDIDLNNQELTIEEIRKKLPVRSDVQEIFDQYLEEQGCNCDSCGSLR